MRRILARHSELSESKSGMRQYGSVKAQIAVNWLFYKEGEGGRGKGKNLAPCGRPVHPFPLSPLTFSLLLLGKA